MSRVQRQLIASLSTGIDREDSAEAFTTELTHSSQYHTAVSEEANQHDGETWYVDFDGKILGVRHVASESILVFSRYYTIQKSDEAVKQIRNPREDDEDPVDRILTMRAIYEHLSDVEAHARIVRYLGQTQTGFRLECLSPGPMPRIWPTMDRAASRIEKANVLALYQRWALQILSAIVYFHSHNVILNQLTFEMLWLREDYSIAIAAPISAGCSRPRVAGDIFSYPKYQIESQWHLYSQWRLHTEGPRWLDEARCSDNQLAGDFRADLFNWATMMHLLAKPDDNPLEQAMYREGSKAASVTKKYNKRLNAINRGQARPHYWPRLPDEMLGSILKKAWMGKYESSLAAFNEAKGMLQSNGVTLTGNDDLAGHDWHNEFEVVNRGISKQSYEIRSRRSIPID